MRLIMKVHTLVVACLLFFSGGLGAQSDPSGDSLTASPSLRVPIAVAALMRYYDRDTGLWNTEGWWNAANSLTVLASVAAAQPSAVPAEVFRNTYRKAQNKFKLFRNDFYDDEGWWALAWIGAYDVTHERRYLAMAESIFADMAGSWDETCSGGIWWSKERKYKNAIANELFLSVAAHLAARSRVEKDTTRYLDWAEREWKWFAKTGMINADHQVNDGLEIGTDAKCVSNRKTTWSYNQGVVVGGLAELYGRTQDAKLLVEANAIATATLASSMLIDKQGILHEPCEPDCGADGTQFKGVFMRNLAELCRIAPNAEYRTFILKNADSVWAGMKPAEYEIGTSWSAPYGKVSASTQSSGVDALVAAIGLS